MLGATAANAATTSDDYTYTGVTHVLTKLQKGFADEVAKRTNGELKIVVRPAGELPFKADEAGRIAGEGQVQVASAFMGFLTGTIPISGLPASRSWCAATMSWPRSTRSSRGTCSRSSRSSASSLSSTSPGARRTSSASISRCCSPPISAAASSAPTIRSRARC